VSGLTSEQIGDLYRAHGRELLLFLARRTCDAQIALDLLGETFAQAVLHRRRFRGDSDEVARAWLFGITRRQLARYYPSRARGAGSALARWSEATACSVSDDALASRPLREP
jgi:DNA-directed RNA polymerase specialized sigma24 family protein